MAGEQESVTQTADVQPPNPVALVRILPEVPVFFVDGVWNQIRGPGIAKFHFYRNDAVLSGSGGYTKNEVLQVVMPALAFADMVAFFEHRLKLMVKHGNLTEKEVEERRAFYAAYPDE